MSTQDGVGEQGAWSPHDEGQLSAEDTLEDRGLDDALDEGYSPPEKYRGVTAFGITSEEARQGESLDQRIAQEDPDWTDTLAGPLSRDDLDDDEALSEADEFYDEQQVGGDRSGRLVAPDEGFGADDESDAIGSDVGIDGGAASAEEAAMHIIE